MKVLFLSTYDVKGGAARATYWLAKGIRSKGLDLTMLVSERESPEIWIKRKNDSNFFHRQIINRQLRLLPKKTSSEKSFWSINLVPNKSIEKAINELSPDIINIHWTGNGFLPIKSLRNIQAPIVWSLYDMWPFTGGCHYSMDCTKYKEFCGKCPQLESNKPDISSLIHWSKRKSWDQIPLTVVAPSAWLAGEAKASTIFRDKSIKVIPHGTDLNLFKRSDQIQSKKILGLDLNKDYLLFASTGGTKDKRKGFAFLHSALNKISKLNLSKKIELLILGSCANNEEFDKLRLPFRHLGIFHDDVSLKVLYSACSLTVTPSLQEAFGMTASESMACGTPVVAFNQCGAKDVVDHMINGYLATPNDSDDLADGIMWSLKNRNRLELEARLKCEKAFDLANVSQRYVDLYKEVINMRHQ